MQVGRWEYCCYTFARGILHPMALLRILSCRSRSCLGSRKATALATAHVGENQDKL